MYKKTSFNQDR